MFLSLFYKVLSIFFIIFILGLFISFKAICGHPRVLINVWGIYYYNSWLRQSAGWIPDEVLRTSLFKENFEGGG